MKDRDEQISFDAPVERIAPEVPRFVVYPGEAWNESETFIVDVSLNGVPIGLRSLIPWKERGWHFGLSEPMCRTVGVDTGDPVHVEMRRPRDTRPDELKALLCNGSQSSPAPFSRDSPVCFPLGRPTAHGDSRVAGIGYLLV